MGILSKALKWIENRTNNHQSLEIEKKIEKKTNNHQTLLRQNHHKNNYAIFYVCFICNEVGLLQNSEYMIKGRH